MKPQDYALSGYEQIRFRVKEILGFYSVTDETEKKKSTGHNHAENRFARAGDPYILPFRTACQKAIVSNS
jgi:hypothetical protein